MVLFLESSIFLIVLGLAMLASLEVGRRIGQRRLREDAEGAQAGIAAVEAAVFGLMGLLLAFTFSGAWTRFDARRDLILAEAKAIGSVWQRTDLLAPNDREGMRADLRAYLDLRLGSTRAGATKADPATAALQGRLWSRALAAAQNDARLVQGFLPVVDQMFDVATARYVAAGAHPPVIVFALLAVLSLMCSALAGYGMAAGKARNWLHTLCFVSSLLAAIYVILEVEFPRRGLVRIDRHDGVLVELREAMK